MKYMTIKKYGLVIAEKSYGESDKILTLLLKNLGKLKVYARGAKKLSSKFFAASQVFSCSEFVISKNKDFYNLSQANLIENLAPRSYTEFCYATYFCELVEKFLSYQSVADNILLLLIKTLKLLPEISPVYIARIFEFKFMQLNGFEPQINFCHSCSCMKNKMYFDGDGLVCENCLDRTKIFCMISDSALTFLRTILSTKFNDLIDKTEVFSRELIAPSRVFISANLDLNLNSKKFIYQIENFSD